MWPISAAFKAKLTGPIQDVRAKLEILDTDFVPVQVVGGIGLDRSMIDASVDLDITRGTRRTLVLSLLNQNAEFSPTSDWGGLFYINRLVRVYRGLVLSGAGTENEQIEYVPCGTFMVDKVETLIERGMSTVVMSGSDLWKKFHKAQFAVATSWPSGTALNTIITELADYAGVTKLSLDPLSNRTSNSKNIQATLSFEKGDTAGDALMKIATDWGLDIYFDPLGVLISQDYRDPMDSSVVWSFGTEDNELHYLMRYINDDERLYNAVHVVGTGDEENIVSKGLTNTDPASPLNVDRLGLRMYRMESGVISTQEAVDKAAETLFHRHSLLSESVALEAICNPALEGNDVLDIVEQDYAGVAARFRITSLSLSLFSSKQKIIVNRVVNLNPS